MKTGVKQGALIGLLAIFLFACGITWLLPDWEKDLAGPYHVEHFTFVSQDGKSLYDINLDTFNTNSLHVQQLSLTGESIQIFSFAIPANMPTLFKLLRAREDRFILYGTTSEAMIFVDPHQQSHWITFDAGLAQNQRLYLDDLHYSVSANGTDEQLVFLGTRINTDDEQASTHHKLMGLINLDGSLKKSLELPEHSELTKLVQDSQGNFILIANLQSQQSSVYIRFNRELDELSRSQQDFRIQSLAGFVNDRIIAYVQFPSDQTGYRALSTTGTPTATVNLPNGFGTQFVSSDSGFFTVTEGIDPLPFGTPLVCFFGADLKRQWCNAMTFIQADQIRIKRAQLLDNRTLLVTVTTDNETFSGVGINSEVDPTSVQAGLEVMGERRHELLHISINNRGQRVAYAKADPYWHKGPVSLCGPFSFCIQPEEIHAGTCGHGDTVVMPEHNILSVSAYCELMSGEWTPRLLHWQF